jgi:hypothetical protein
MTKPKLNPAEIRDLPLERRESTRFPKEPGTDFAQVCLATGETRLVEVQNESLGGLCVVMSETTGLTVGSRVRLIYHRDVLHGEVRHITQRPDGSFVVGFACHA